MKHFVLFILAILSCLTGFAQGGYNPENPGDPNPYRKLTVLASPKAGGSVSPNNESQVGVGQTVSCYADESKYYDFVHWLQNGEVVSTDNSFSFVMPDEDVEMVAVFETNYNPQSPNDPQEVKPSHRVTLTAIPGKGGHFNTSAFKLCEGDSINIYAYPNEGYRFDEWLLDGVLVSTKNPLKVKMIDKDLKYTARFSYNPINPSDPAVNLFNPATGEMVIDKFERGYLSSAISRLLNDDYSYSEIQSLIVSGMMDSSDFGVMSRLVNCSVIDLSRTNGYTEIPSYALESMTSMTELLLPSCINSIGGHAFEDCINLSVITCYAIIPPSLANSVFDGIDASIVVKVPTQSIELYKNAQGWKEFTILPADTDTYSILVSLPSDANDGRYKNMSIELLNTSNGQRYKYLITDKTEYSFANLLSSTQYSVYVKNAKNEILGEITDLEVIDNDLTVAFQSLRQPKNITVKVITPDGNDVTSEVTVKWFNETNELLQQGSTLQGVLENSIVSYTVTLPQTLQQSYMQPSTQVITILGQEVLTCTLEELGKCTLEGKVSDVEGKAIATAIITISQNINGSYANSMIVQCDKNGTYQVDLPNVPLKVNISANGYIGQTKELQTASTGIGDIVLGKHTGITLYPSYTFQESVVIGEEVSKEVEWFSDDANIAYRIEDLSGNEIPNCIYQSGSIILPESIELGEKIRLIAYSKNHRFNDVAQTLSLNSKSTYVELSLVEYGGISITVNDEDITPSICLLYNELGRQVGSSAFRSNNASFGNLPDGQYTVISMRKSSLLGRISNLSSFQEIQLEQGSDYLLNKVNVVTGQITDINIAHIPDLDETKLYYTNGKETYFMPNKSQLTIGNYVTLKAKLTIKDEYSDDVDAATLVVDIPSNCEFIDNSIISGSGYLGYEYADNRLSIPIQNLSDAVRFCVVPIEGGDCKLSAFVKLIIDNKEILQPIGLAYFEVENFSLAAPKKTSKTNIAIRGTATSDSEVLIYDNETLVGSTYSMPNGQWSLNLSLYKPYSKSIHNLYGEVITQDGKRLLTQSKTVDYDQSYVDLSKVTMVYNNTNIVFDHLNGRNTSNSYSYNPSIGDFTFIADFTENNPEKVSNVIIKILASDGSQRSIPAEYNPTTGNWIVRTKYTDSNKLPVNVTADFKQKNITSIFDENRFSEEEEAFNEEYNKVQRLLLDGESKILKDLEESQIVSILPVGEDEWEYLEMKKIDTNQLKKEFEEFKTYTYVDNECNFTFRDSIADNVYNFYWINNINEEAYVLKYYGTKSIDIRQTRLAPLVFPVVGIVGGVLGTSIDWCNHRGIIDYWKRQLIYDKDRMERQYVDLINALYAECENGDLKIKDPITFEIDERAVEKWADESYDFLRRYKLQVDIFEQYYNLKWLGTNVLNVVVTGITFGISRIPPVQAVMNTAIDALVTELCAIGGNVMDNKMEYDKDGNPKPNKFICNWYDVESQKIRDLYIKVIGDIKSDYSNCEDKDEDEDSDGDFPVSPTTPSIDPSGYVYEAVPSNRIAGVTTTAYCQQQNEDMYGDVTETAVVWDALPFGQENPLITDSQGMYAWDVPAGMWQVRFEKEGYDPAQSEWLPVPPPQLDVNIGMTQVKQPEVTKAHAYSDGVTIEFDKYMLPSTLSIGNISLTQNGNIVDGVIEASDIEFDTNGNAFCSKIEYKSNEPLAEGEVTLFVSKAVKSYANINMSEDFMQTFTIEPRVAEIRVNQSIDVNSGSIMRVSASVLPAAAAKGKKILVESLNPMIATVSSQRVETDVNGNITFDVYGLILGSTGIKLSIEDYDITTVISVNVLASPVENQVATPYASVESGQITSGTEIYLSCDTENAIIYYTLDGSCPCVISRQKYDGTPIVIDKDLTLKIMAEAPGMIESEIAEYQYFVYTTEVEAIQIDKDLNIYPLPLGEYLTISNGDDLIESVSIFDLSGKLMVYSNKSEKQMSLEVGFLSPGIYTLNIKSNGNTIVKKVIKR